MTLSTLTELATEAAEEPGTAGYALSSAVSEILED
jgi:hypothetical protein